MEAMKKCTACHRPAPFNARVCDYCQSVAETQVDNDYLESERPDSTPEMHYY